LLLDEDIIGNPVPSAPLKPGAVMAVPLGPDTPVREVMTEDVKYCYEDDDTADVARNMADIQVRRLPVLTRDKRLVGMISLGDMAVTEGASQAGEAVAGISQPSSQHSQTGGPRT
jgi:CBS domain-containing protein